jgi:peptide/nickel transport system substrate-binding protein
MDHEARRRLEEYRRKGAGPYENALIDDYTAGAIDRRELMRRAGLLGISTPVIGVLLRTFGEPAPAFGAARAAASSTRIRVGIIPPPSGALEPSTLSDLGGLQTIGIPGEFLARATQSKTLLPELATSWKTNKSATVWTFKLRPNVTFQTGQPLTSADVVATWQRLATKGSAALSAIGGYVTPEGIVAVDDLTVAFHLETPVSNFPYLVSSTTYQGVILPANYQLGTFATKPQTTGAFQLAAYTPGVSATYNRYAGWWGGTAPLAGVDVTYYTAAAAADAALLGGDVDLLGQVQLATDRALFNNSKVKIFSARGSTHREVPIRVDENNPFRDYRVRQAVALTLNRPQIVKTLFNDLAEIGNDSPFAPIYGLARSVPQRKQNIRQAKQLLAAAGHSKGFSAKLVTEQLGEIPELAQIIQSSVKEIGIHLSLSILSVDAYYAGTQTGPPKGWGDTPWLNAEIDITDYGSRAVPNVFLTSALETKGVWNAAHYSNKKFDAGVKSFLGAATFDDQDKYAVILQKILLHDTPVIFPYFYYYLAAGTPSVSGYSADAVGQLYLSKTSLT